MSKLSRLYHTVIHLRREQLRYRLKNLVLPPKSFPFKEVSLTENHSGNKTSFIARQNPFIGREIQFLNQSISFNDDMDWDYSGYGKLWTYNLNYFDFLMADSLELSQKRSLIGDFISRYNNLKTAKEPYPLSLRILNCCKFITQYQIQDTHITSLIATDVKNLSKKIEYHILGNHLLENAFALLVGGVVLGDQQSIETGFSILKRQFPEQILGDGGHFERSPMYQQIILERVLDCINIIPAESRYSDITTALRLTAISMLTWLQNTTFINGDIAMVNDAAYGIASSTDQLTKYASQLEIKSTTDYKLGESGYRMIHVGVFELFIDAGDIGPDYLPAHAHCDTLSFILYLNNTPFLVDTGTSTYEVGERRQIERSTASHNTVVVKNTEQSEIWGAFRVARRAYGEILEETDSKIVATHTGYKRIGANHTRTFEWLESKITITDTVTPGFSADAYLHFHDDVVVEISGDSIITPCATIKMIGAESIRLESYELCKGFNLRVESTKACIKFRDSLKTVISIKSGSKDFLKQMSH